MKKYILALSTYNIDQTIDIELAPKELELLNDISKSLEKQKASIQLEVREK